MSSFGFLVGEKTPICNFQAQMNAILGSFKFFQDLDPGLQAALPSIITSMSKRAGTVLFRQGDPPGNCYIVMSGEAGIFVASEEEPVGDSPESPKSISGTKTVEGFSTYNEETNFGPQIGSLGPGTLCGELALLNDQPRSASIRCVQDTDFLVIRRSDFDNILKEEMVRKGDEKLKFLMAHMPGMRDVTVPKSGAKGPHASYYFKKACFQRGHCFFQEGAVAESSITLLYKGTVECRRSEHAPIGVGAALPTLASTPAFHADHLPGGAKLGNFRKSVGMVARSNYQSSLQSMARVQEVHETVNRLGVLMPGSVFGSLPLQEKEPFTVSVTSQQCEVFMCSGQDLSKLPRKLLDTVREYIAQAAAWRLKSHQSTQDFRKFRQPDKLAVKHRPLLHVKSAPTI
jgi:CRP-like cAMP-binding protein